MSIKVLVKGSIVIPMMLLATVAMGQSKETLGERVARTSAEEAKSEVSQDPHEELVHLRAQAKELDKKINETLSEVSKKDTKEMKEARKELQHEADMAREEERKMAKAIALGGVTGCSPVPEDSPKLVVYPRATGDGAYTAHIRVRVKNPHLFPIGIDDEKGVLVENLGPGCSITLFRALGFWLSDQIVDEFQFTARGYFPDGSPGEQYSKRYRLNARNTSNGVRAQIDNWSVHLHRIQTER